MPTQSIDSLKLSATASPSEVVDAIEGAAETLAELITDEIDRLVQESWAKYEATKDMASFDGIAVQWRTFTQEEILPRIAATFDLALVVTVVAADMPRPGEHSEPAVQWAMAQSHRFGEMGKDVQGQLYYLIGTSVRDELTIEQTAERLQRGMVGLSPGQAMTLARTELMGAYTNGDRAWADAMPTRQRPKEHVWHAVMDGATRPAHAEAHDQVQPYRLPFTVGGESMLHPHALGSSAANVVNCRCVEVMLWDGDKRPDGSIVGAEEAAPEPVVEPTLPEPPEETVAALDPHPYELDRRKGHIIRPRPSTEEGRAEFMAKAEELKANAGAVKVSVTREGIFGIANDGRFKTAHEVASSRGKVHGTTAYKNPRTYVENRKTYEDGIMGIPSVSSSRRPVYGWGDGKVAPNYGGFQVVLKPNVRGRTTVTFGDSLDAKLRPIWLDELDSATFDQLWEATDGSWVPYTEYQIHGGVQLSDIARIVATPSEWTMVGPRTIKVFEEAGIEMIHKGGKAGRAAMEAVQ